MEPDQDGCFTQGSDCTIVVHEGNVEKFDVEKLPKELLVDTNGAGMHLLVDS